MDNLQAQLQRVQAQIAQEETKGAAERNDAKLAQLRQDEADIIKHMDEQVIEEQNEQINSKQTDYSAGLKELLFQALESSFPKDIMSQLMGLSEYSESAQGFRQLVDMIVDENTEGLYAVIGQQMEAKDGKIREVTAKGIDLDAKLQESIRKEADIQAQNERLQAENEKGEQENIRLTNDLAEKDAKIEELTRELAARDEQIAKLEALAKEPQAQISLTTGQPSQALKDRLQQSGTKVRSALEIALEGRNYRGTVQITPPSIPAPQVEGAESADSFRNEGEEVPAAVAGNGGVQDSQPVGDSFREDQDALNAVGGDAALSTVVEQAIESRIKALEERVSKLEQGKPGVAA